MVGSSALIKIGYEVVTRFVVGAVVAVVVGGGVDELIKALVVSIVVVVDDVVVVDLNLGLKLRGLNLANDELSVVVVVVVEVMFAGLVNGVAVDVVDGWLRT